MFFLQYRTLNILESLYPFLFSEQLSCKVNKRMKKVGGEIGELSEEKKKLKEEL